MNDDLRGLAALEPALALIRGRAARILLADEVGLGKTIQAALMLAELQQRGWCERALVLSPAGLCQQWADELRDSDRARFRATSRWHYVTLDDDCRYDPPRDCPDRATATILP